MLQDMWCHACLSVLLGDANATGNMQLCHMTALQTVTEYSPSFLCVSKPCVHTGNADLDVQDGTFRQEPGSGVCGQVQGISVAVGNLDWVHSHSQTDAISSNTQSDHSSNGGSSHRASAAGKLSEPARISSDSSSSSTSSSSSSDNGLGHAMNDNSQDSDASLRSGEQASTSGRSAAGEAGVMTVYVGVNGKLAGVVEMRDELRPDAAATIRGLQQQGIDTILLSGERLAMVLTGLGCAVLCCAVLCCAVLCCAVLCCAVLCCAALPAQPLLC